MKRAFDPFVAACSTALSIASLDVLLAEVLSEESIRIGGNTMAALGPFTLIASLTFAAFLGLYFTLIGISQAEGSGNEKMDKAACLCVAMLVTFSLSVVLDLYRVSMLRELPVVWAVRAGLIVCAFALAYLFASRKLRAMRPASRRWAHALSMFVFPWLAMAAALVTLGFAESFGRKLGIAAIAAAGLGVLTSSMRRKASWAMGRVLVAVCFLAVVLATGAMYVFSEGGQVQSKSSGSHSIPRVLLITVDTLRQDSVGAFSGSSLTPNIDRLASESFSFPQAFTTAPWTIPSFVSMFTGLTPDIHGVDVDRAAIPEALPTLAEQFRDSGYLTASVVFHPQLKNMGRGFTDPHFYPEDIGISTATVGGNILFNLAKSGLRYDMDMITDVAIDWMRNYESQDSFLWVHYLDPHLPYAPPRDYLDSTELVERFGTGYRSDYSRIKIGRDLRLDEERNWLRELYDAEVRYVDDNVGRLLDYLREKDLYDETLIVFATDHGEEFWDHGGFEHGHSLFNELLLSPLLIKQPRQTAGKTVDTVVSTASIFTTLLEATGSAYESHSLLAPSILPLLSEEDGDRGGHVAWFSANEYFTPLEGVAFDGFKYIRSTESLWERVFDLIEDGGETTAVNDQFPDVVDRARTLLSERERLRDAWLAGAGALVQPQEELPTQVREELESIGYLP